jgi:hypothetical protein
MATKRDLDLNYVLQADQRVQLTPPETIEVLARVVSPSLASNPLFIRSATPTNQAFVFIHAVITQDDAVDAFRKAVRQRRGFTARADLALAIATIAGDLIWQRPETVAAFGKKVCPRLGKSAHTAFLAILDSAQSSQVIRYLQERHMQIPVSSRLFNDTLDVIEQTSYAITSAPRRAQASAVEAAMRARL